MQAFAIDDREGVDVLAITDGRPFRSLTTLFMMYLHQQIVQPLLQKAAAWIQHLRHQCMSF